MKARLIVGILREIAISLLILWLIVFGILIMMDYKVTSYDPNDDLLELLEQSIDEDKVDLEWEKIVKDDKKTTVYRRRFIFIPGDNSLLKKLKQYEPNGK